MDDEFSAELEYLLRRPEKKARQRRVLDALDELCPNWELIARDARFLALLHSRSDSTRKSWGEALVALSSEFDGSNLAALFHVLEGRMQGTRPSIGTELAGGRYIVGDLVAKHYEVIDLLGAGGFGEVLLVYSHEAGMHTFHAMKVMLAGHAVYESTFSRFAKEAYLLTGLRPHSCVVHTPTIELIGGSALALFSEVVLPDGRGRITLAEHISSGELTTETQTRLMIECCAGLQAAFEDGVLAHRDLKPANILLGARMHARVADFGLARVDTGTDGGARDAPADGREAPGVALTGSGRCFGTPPYMAPEQFIDAANCDQRSDVYSLGIILYEMVTRGRLPFVAHSDTGWEGWARLHFSARVQTIEHPLATVIEKCLAKNPNARFQSAGELAEALSEFRVSRGWRPVSIEPRDEFSIDAVQSRMNRAVGLHRLGHHRRAIDLFEECAQRFDLAANDAYAYQVLCYKSICDYTGAIDCGLRIPDSRRSDDTETSLGYCYAKTERWDLAVIHYNRAVELNPASLNAWENLAQGYSALGRPKEALAAIEACTALPDAGPNQWKLHARIKASFE